ncbi:MAG TPA: transglycosylase domain-containing protein, partial [Anaerovoracaceae bacterium]|nr:transglycosylase domain-containing protein [Anaerovoracaceae bacterium]
MTDEFDKADKQKEIDDFFDKFDRISNVFDKSINRMEQHHNESDNDLNPTSSGNPEVIPDQSSDLKANKTRLERLSESKPQSIFTSKLGTSKKGEVSQSAAGGSDNGSNNDSPKVNGEEPMTTHKKKKKYIINKKQLLKFIALAFLGVCLVLGGIIISIIVKAPAIEPDKIYSLLSENSVLYDDEGNIVDSLLTSDGLRTNVSYTDLPQDLVDAFVSIEDKTFWDHNGFNIVRILGAIKEGIFEGDSISGTSTITQQLARNLYLAETKSDYSLTRKIKEAYYTVLLERHLSKKQILEAYLNTIFLGYNTNGVQAASQAYFSKDVQELTLAECVALASLPQAPDRYALVKRYENSQVTADDPNIIRKGDTYTLVYNDTYLDRKDLVLSFMLNQEKITQAEHDEAKAVDLKASINPSQDTSDEISFYFADYAIKQIVKDLMEELDLDEAEAKQMIYNNGLKIYSTMNSRIQKIAEEEFTNNANFPKVTGLKKDGAGNILSANGKIMLYSYDSYFNVDGTFILTPDEYQAADDGGIRLLEGKRLNFYKTEVQGQTDYSVEFKDMYIVQDGVLYVIKGGVIKIPQQYKSRDNDGNLEISGQFFTDQPDVFQFVPQGIALGNGNYSLKQKVIQPQSAMVVFDYEDGGIKAMVGGRNTEGRMLFNRAIQPRQPGSSIKPMGVYGPALQSGLDKANSGLANTPSEGNSYGSLWTAGSIIDDAPLTIQGKLWPKNWYAGYRGLHSMRESLEQSINVNAVKIFSDIGVQTSLNFLKKCGITTIVESGDVNDMNAAALALGGMTEGVSPLEMVAGYSSFANEGNYIEPTAYTKVTNKNGEVILEKTAEETRIMDQGVAFIVQDMLRSVVTNGIGGSAAIGSQPVAGKTGTTSENYDAWFVGFTPQYAASVWIGNDVNVELSQGSVSAAKLWSKIMKRVHEGIAPGSFSPAPGNVISVAVDIKSGRLPSELSALDPRSTVRNEYFIKGTEPTTTDNVHVAVNVCSDSGYLATPYCFNNVSRVFVKRPYTVDPKVADYSYELPSYYCYLHNPNVTQYPIDPSKTLSPGSDIWDGNNGDP